LFIVISFFLALSCIPEYMSYEAMKDDIRGAARGEYIDSLMFLHDQIDSLNEVLNRDTCECTLIGIKRRCP
jgi:hypothetical protein